MIGISKVAERYIMPSSHLSMHREREFPKETQLKKPVRERERGPRYLPI